MRQDREKIFQSIEHIEPPYGLLGSILARISEAQRRNARTRLAFWSAGALVALGALVPVLRYAGQEFSQSGFYDYFSLLFSDGSMLLANSWKELALSLAESLPLMGVTLVLATFFVLLGLIRLIGRDMQTAFLSTQLR